MSRASAALAAESASVSTGRPGASCAAETAKLRLAPTSPRNGASHAVVGGTLGSASDAAIQRLWRGVRSAATRETTASHEDVGGSR